MPPLIEQYKLALKSEKEAVLLKDKAGNKLKQLLENNEIGRIGNNIVSWKKVMSSKIDTDRLKVEQSEIYNKYLTQSSYRRFSIK